jgi:hypothetical protein
VDCTSVLAFVTADKKCLKYFQNLEAGSFDAGAMVRRQAAVLVELAAVDARLASLDSEATWGGAGLRRYREERGGDVALGLLRPMAVDDDRREFTSDAKRLYALARPQVGETVGFYALPRPKVRDTVGFTRSFGPR